MIINDNILIGYAAAALTTIAFVPQVLKILKHKRADDISAGMYATFVIGVSLWLIYGFLKDDLPMILANAITLLLACSVIIMKIKYSLRKNKDNV